MPICPRNQPSASTTPSALRPRSADVGDVVGLHLQPLVVLGEAGGQLGVADPLAVEERLVDALRGGVQPGRRRPAGRRRTRSRSSAAGRSPGAPVGHRARARPTTPASPSVQSSPVSNQAGSDHALSPRSVAHRAPATRPAGTDASGGPGVGHQQALVAVDPAGVPAVVGGDPVGALLAGAVGQPPGQPRRRRPDAERLVEVLDPQPDGAAVTRSPGRRSAEATEVAGAAARPTASTSPGSTAQPAPGSQCRRARGVHLDRHLDVSPGLGVHRRRSRPASGPAASTAESGPRGVDLHDLLAARGPRCCAPGRVTVEPVAGRRRRVDRLVLPGRVAEAVAEPVRRLGAARQ